MFGSWYHDSKAMDIIKETYLMADWAAAQRDKAARTEFAVFMDEVDRVYWETTENGAAAMESLRMSGLTPDIYMLEDIVNPNLPVYKFYLFFSPVTITQAQLEAIKDKAGKYGKVVMFVGPTGVCGSFKAASPVLSAFGLQITDALSVRMRDEVITFREDMSHPLLLNCRGRLGSRGVKIMGDTVSYLFHRVWGQIPEQRDVSVLGYWHGTSEPGLVYKYTDGYHLIYSSQIAGVSA